MGWRENSPGGVSFLASAVHDEKVAKSQHLGGLARGDIKWSSNEGLPQCPHLCSVRVALGAGYNPPPAEGIGRASRSGGVSDLPRPEIPNNPIRNFCVAVSCLSPNPPWARYSRRVDERLALGRRQIHVGGWFVLCRLVVGRHARRYWHLLVGVGCLLRGWLEARLYGRTRDV
jgi:hypothetical protein